MGRSVDSDPARELSARQRFGNELWRLADLVRAGERRRSFRAKAFRTAFWALDDLAPDLSGSSEEMTSVPGIGPGLVRLIEEFRSTDRIAELERLAARLPAESARLRRLPRMTPRILEDLKVGWGIDSAVQLEMMIEEGEIEAVKGVGPETAAGWSGILALWPDDALLPAHQAWVLASVLRSHLARHLSAEVVMSGQVRRVTEWVATIRLAVECESPAAVSRFLSGSVIGNQFEEGQDGELIATRTPYGTPLAVHPSTPDGFGTILFKSTGPRLHVERIGDPGPLPTEEAVYASVDSPWVPPSAREVEGTIPDSLVMSSSIRGDLHVHSQASPDGRLSVDEIAALLASRGYEFGAITDHTWGLRFGGLDPEALGGQRALIDAVNSNRSDLILLHGAEVNIDKEGGLDIPDEVLATLDLVVAGVHSAFGLPRSEQTARVIRAIRNPRVRILAHPTGRRVGMRAPLDLDLESVIAAAIEEGVALEVNGHRDRLDLSSDLAGAAVGAGALVVANSDAHRVDELGNVSNAVATLQRAAVTTERVVNAWGSQALLDWARHMA